MKTIKLHKGHYEYRGFEIEKMESGQWNIREINADVWSDAAYSLGDAKLMIDRWMDNN